MKAYNYIVYTNDLITNTCLCLREEIWLASLVEGEGLVVKTEETSNSLAANQQNLMRVVEVARFIYRIYGSIFSTWLFFW